MGSIPVSGRSPGGGHSNPLQYSCLENSMDREAWWDTVHQSTKSWTQLKWLSTHVCYRIRSDRVVGGQRFWLKSRNAELRSVMVMCMFWTSLHGETRVFSKKQQNGVGIGNYIFGPLGSSSWGIVQGCLCLVLDPIHGCTSVGRKKKTKTWWRIGHNRFLHRTIPSSVWLTEWSDVNWISPISKGMSLGDQPQLSSVTPSALC